MPDLPVQALKEKQERMEKTKSSLSSSSSISESIPPKPNPLQQMMLGMLMSQNMRMMMGEDESSAPSRKSRKSTSSSHSNLPPIIINPPPMYQPPPPIQQPLPRIDSAKPKRPKVQKAQSVSNIPTQLQIQPTLLQPVQPTTTTNVNPIAQQPTYLPSVVQNRPSSVKSMSVEGQPIQPPSKPNRLADANNWNIEPPRPSMPVDISRPPSLRDTSAPPQSSLD